VEGTSTLHEWTVEGEIIQGEVIFHEIEPASLWTNSNAGSQTFAVTVHVEIPAESLKSDKSGLDKKMYQALRAKTHPLISYRLEAAEVLAGLTINHEDAKKSLVVHTRGILTAAGVERQLDFPMQIKQLSDDRLEVSGETSLKMTDFGIDPPTAMLGLLHTGNTVRVRWSWVLARSPVQDYDDQ
jgi:polyisoprenoid-binding protein YceI